MASWLIILTMSIIGIAAGSRFIGWGGALLAILIWDAIFVLAQNVDSGKPNAQTEVPSKPKDG